MGDSGVPEKCHPPLQAPNNWAPSLARVYERDDHPTWTERALWSPADLLRDVPGEELRMNQAAPGQRQQLPLADNTPQGACPGPISEDRPTFAVLATLPLLMSSHPALAWFACGYCWWCCLPVPSSHLVLVSACLAIAHASALGNRPHLDSSLAVCIS